MFYTSRREHSCYIDEGSHGLCACELFGAATLLDFGGTCDVDETWRWPLGVSKGFKKEGRKAAATKYMRSYSS